MKQEAEATKVFLLIRVGGDCFESHWEQPLEVHLDEKRAAARVEFLNYLCDDACFDYSYKLKEFEIGKEVA